MATLVFDDPLNMTAPPRDGRRPDTRFSGVLVPGVVLRSVLTTDEYPKGMVGVVFDVYRRRNGFGQPADRHEEYGILIENGYFAWFKPWEADLLFDLTGHHDAKVASYRFASEAALRQDLQRGVFARAFAMGHGKDGRPRLSVVK